MVNYYKELFIKNTTIILINSKTQKLTHTFNHNFITFEYMQETLKSLPQRAKDTYTSTKKFFAKLKKKPPKGSR